MHIIELLKTQHLPDFPSGSSINYRDNLLYLVGDDANTILILDKEYVKVSSVQLFNYPGKRIPKSMKTDLETSAFISLNDLDYLLVVGSASTAQREKVILIPFSESKLTKAKALTINTNDFINRLRSMGIPEVNIEGVTIIGEMLMFSNRSNRNNTTNHFVITAVDFWEHQSEVNIKIIPLDLSEEHEEAMGISEICYVKGTDTLLISFSSEHTHNAYDDGLIGDSYIGWINNMGTKINQPSLVMDQMINLTTFHAEFQTEKIEGLCVESVDEKDMIVNLISDNDQGNSKLFKVRISTT